MKLLELPFWFQQLPDSADLMASAEDDYWYIQTCLLQPYVLCYKINKAVFFISCLTIEGVVQSMEYRKDDFVFLFIYERANDRLITFKDINRPDASEIIEDKREVESATSITEFPGWFASLNDSVFYLRHCGTSGKELLSTLTDKRYVVIYAYEHTNILSYTKKEFIDSVHALFDPIILYDNEEGLFVKYYDGVFSSIVGSA